MISTRGRYAIRVLLDMMYLLHQQREQQNTSFLNLLREHLIHITRLVTRHSSNIMLYHIRWLMDGSFITRNQL